MRRGHAQKFRLQHALVTVALLPSLVGDASANPNGLIVTQGSASAVVSGAAMTINASHNAILDWRSFNIAAGETTTFQQPSASSIVWNRINDSFASHINGNLNANGFVVLFNQSGFYFGPQSIVNVGGLLVTTSPIMPSDFISGGLWQYNGPPPAASIVNYGQIKVNNGGSVYLISEKIENHGIIMAPDGNIGLYAGKEVLVSDRPDGRGLSASVRLPAGSVDNNGKLIADAGTIAMHAQVVNQNGLVQANSVRQHNGQIEFIASDTINLNAGSMITANGDASASSDAGNVIIKSQGTFNDVVGSQISVAGGALGGAGGHVEVSANQLGRIHSQIDGKASGNWVWGSLLIDPQDMILDANNTDFTGVTMGQIALAASGNITLNTVWDLEASIAPTPLSKPRQLSLNAGGDIVFASGAKLIDSSATRSSDLTEPFPNWSVQLVAGSVDSAPPSAGPAGSSAMVNNGVGNIFLGGTPDSSGHRFGNGSIQLQGDLSKISLFAGNDIRLGSGSVTTTGGGSIEAMAAAGSIKTYADGAFVNGNNPVGVKLDGYNFRVNGYTIAPAGAGGISTVRGGDISLTAGADIISWLPRAGDSVERSAASGAFLSFLDLKDHPERTGNVTLTAGGSVQGSFIVANGRGEIRAGVKIDPNTGAVVKDSSGKDVVVNSASQVGTTQFNNGGESIDTPVALSLIRGSWDIHSGGDIFLQEVRNPNGAFNNNRINNQRNLFDYAADATVSLSAANSVNLLGNDLPRVSVPVIYPGSLSISAGKGGVTLSSEVILAPSAQGNLEIATTDGGSLRGTVIGNKSLPLKLSTSDQWSIVMSDSSSKDYKAFDKSGPTAHSDPPLHLTDTVPVKVKVDGNIQNVGISVPKFATVDVNGDTANFAFTGQNLRAGDVTSIRVAGNVFNKLIDQVSTPIKLVSGLPDANFGVLTRAQAPDPDNISQAAAAAYTAANNLSVDPITGELVYSGIMPSSFVDWLLTPHQVTHLDQFDMPIVNPDGTPKLFTEVFTMDVAAVRSLYDKSQFLVSFQNTGFQIGGPGAFAIHAGNLNLGISDGINSVGPQENPFLAKLGTKGADISITLDRNLDMVASRITSISGGGITIDAGGAINAGSQQQFGGSSIPKGIYTTTGSPVSVTANGDININGSRIATYDGGALSVLSRTGDVNAGSGGLGFVIVNQVIANPDGSVTQNGFTIPGSGILATALPGSTHTVGDVNVEASQGSINANSGGVIQLPFNNSDSKAGTVTLFAPKGDINANNSGVIGANVVLKAGGNVSGLVVSRGNIDINATQSVNVTALAQGNVSVATSSSGTIGGTIVAGGNVSADAGSISGNIVSTSANVSGDKSGASVGVQATSAARSDSKSTDDADKKVMTAKKSDDEDELLKKNKGPAPLLAKSTGRVTVILPKK